MKESKAKNIIGKLTEAYVVFFVVAFPLFVHDKYFSILNDKFYLFWVSCAMLVGASVIVVLACAFTASGRSSDKASEKASGKATGKRGFGGIRLTLRTPDKFFLVFMAVSIVSTAVSEYPYEAFWGQYGRYQGLFTWLFYGALYVLISRFYRAKRRHMDLFLVVGALLSLWGITDYLGFDIFGWRDAIGDPDFLYSFSSGIGNINSLTLMLALYMGASAVMFLSEQRGDGTEAVSDRQSLIRKVLYGATLFLSFMAEIMALSDNAVLAVGLLLYLLPFYAWRDRRGVRDYLLVLTLFAGALFLSGLLRTYINDYNWAVYRETGEYPFDLAPESLSGILMSIATTQNVICGQLTIICLCLAAFSYFLSISGYRRRQKSELSTYTYGDYETESLGRTPRYIWGAFGALCLAAIIWVFYDANTGGHPEIYGPYANIFIFSDYWGTNRGYNWKLLLSYFLAFLLLRKLIGAGPETYGVYTSVRDYYTMIETTNETYDSPHNELLQHLFSVGIIGTIGYYGGLITATLRGIFGREANAISAACGFGVLCYTAGAMIAISAPTVTPMMILLLSICVGESHREDRDQGDKAGSKKPSGTSKQKR